MINRVAPNAGACGVSGDFQHPFFILNALNQRRPSSSVVFFSIFSSFARFEKPPFPDQVFQGKPVVYRTLDSRRAAVKRNCLTEAPRRIAENDCLIRKRRIAVIAIIESVHLCAVQRRPFQAAIGANADFFSRAFKRARQFVDNRRFRRRACVYRVLVVRADFNGEPIIDEGRGVL